jgi:hypothetical protein
MSQEQIEGLHRFLRRGSYQHDVCPQRRNRHGSGLIKGGSLRKDRLVMLPQGRLPHLDNAPSTSSPFLGTLRRRTVSRQSHARRPLRQVSSRRIVSTPQYHIQSWLDSRCLMTSSYGVVRTIIMYELTAAKTFIK